MKKASATKAKKPAAPKAKTAKPKAAKGEAKPKATKAKAAPKPKKAAAPKAVSHLLYIPGVPWLTIH